MWSRRRMTASLSAMSRSLSLLIGLQLVEQVGGCADESSECEQPSPFQLSHLRLSLTWSLARCHAPATSAHWRVKRTPLSWSNHLTVGPCTM